MEPTNISSTTESCVLKNIGALIVGLILGCVIFIFVYPKLPSTISNSQKEYQAGFDAAKGLVEKSSLGVFFTDKADVRIVSGTVASVLGNNQFVIHSNMNANPFADETIIDRTILVTPSTKIVVLVPKDSKFVEQQLLSKSDNTSISATVPSQIYDQRIVTASEIKVGDSLTVIALENVKNLKQFTPTEIQILPKLF